MPTTKITFINVIVFFRAGSHCQCSDIVPRGAISVVLGRRYRIKLLNKADWTERGSPPFLDSKIMRELFVKVVWQIQPICNIDLHKTAIDFSSIATKLQQAYNGGKGDDNHDNNRAKHQQLPHTNQYDTAAGGR